MTPNPWFRMYHEFATDPKVQMLSEVDQRRFIMLLCLRCCNGDVTLQDDAVTFQLRISAEEWAATKGRLIAKGLIGDDNKPNAWEKRQYASDSSKNRVAKHREKKRNAEVKRYSNGTEAEAEKETEEEKIPHTPLAGERTTSGSDFWSKALNPDPFDAGIRLDQGRILLSPEKRTYWLGEFDGNAKRLDMALREVGGRIQPNRSRPLAAQVESQLARIVGDKLDRDGRYQAAANRGQPDKQAAIAAILRR